MVRKNIQRSYPDKGDLSVDFTVSFDGSNATAESIEVHSNFKSEIHEYVTIEYHDQKLKLVNTTSYGRDNIIEKKYLDSDISNDIVTEIMKVLEEETPKFTT